MSTEALRELLQRAFTESLRAIDLRSLVAEALPPEPPVSGRVVLFAFGKAAPRMAAGALDRFGNRIDKALVVTTDGTDTSCIDGRAEILRASHPIPDERSLVAAERALSLVPHGSDDLLLALVSGGSSSLLHAPPPGMSLEELRELCDALIRSDATIQRINTVRRHLSRVHGGRLARAAYPARTLTLYASDVPNGEAFDVGSGPTVADPTSIEDAREALAEALGSRMAARMARFLTPSLDPASKEAEHIEAYAIARPQLLAEALAERLRAEGFTVEVSEESAASAESLLESYEARARSLAPRSAVAIPCEPSLRITGKPGRGGRAGWLALALLPKLPADVVFLAGASDGVDGSSGTAGAIVSGDIPYDASAVAKALAGFDDASMHAALGTSLAGGPTGLNLTDIHVLVRG